MVLSLNPYAIARVRLSAFQKCIVMRYVDTVLDRADSLFAQFTPEWVNEATMLYAMAANVLGIGLGSSGRAHSAATLREPTRRSLRGSMRARSCCLSSRHGSSREGCRPATAGDGA